jgi:hypothetical protein
LLLELELEDEELLELEDEELEDQFTESSSCSKSSRISGEVAGFSRSFLRKLDRSVRPLSLLAMVCSS